MAITEILSEAMAGAMVLVRARFLAIGPDGYARVRLGQPSGREIHCDVLRVSGEDASRYADQQEVLIAFPTEPGRRAVLMGAIGPAASERAVDEAAIGEASSGAAPPPEAVPQLRGKQVAIEAGEELTLRCGEASIRITRDGKIVIRGEHVLSRAKGTNRIKGGSVAIN